MKASVSINVDEWMFMSHVVNHTSDVKQIHFDPLAVIVIQECYERNLKLFTFIRDCTKSFRASDILAWLNILTALPLSPGYQDILRNNLLNKFNKAIETACPGINTTKSLATTT